MTVTNIEKDFDNLTLTLTAEFEAPVARVWELWSDPRKLERWWGPPTYPATVETHDLAPGGEVTYYMTGPEGDRHHGWWQLISVEPPSSLEFRDGFADPDGKPLDDMPVTVATVNLTAQGGITRMELRSSYETAEQMKQLVEMGMEEGLKQAVGQMDAILALGFTPAPSPDSAWNPGSVATRIRRPRRRPPRAGRS